MQGIRQPDLIFYLRPSTVEDMTTRADFGNERYESLQIQSQVTQNFDDIFKGNENVFVIDSSQSIESISAIIATSVEKLLAQNKERS